MYVFIQAIESVNLAVICYHQHYPGFGLWHWPSFWWSVEPCGDLVVPWSLSIKRFLYECATTIIMIYSDPPSTYYFYGKSHTVDILPKFSMYLEVQTVVITCYRSKVSLRRLDS